MDRIVIFELTDEEKKQLETDLAPYGGSKNGFQPVNLDLFRTKYAVPAEPNKKTRYRATVPDLFFSNEPAWKLKVVQ